MDTRGDDTRRKCDARHFMAMARKRIELRCDGAALTGDGEAWSRRAGQRKGWDRLRSELQRNGKEEM